MAVFPAPHAATRTDDVNSHSPHAALLISLLGFGEPAIFMGSYSELLRALESASRPDWGSGMAWVSESAPASA
jgi:hypothetical protein